MHKLWKDICPMHDHMSGFGHMHRLVPGVEYYCDRALLLPVPLAVIHENGSGRGLIDDHLEFLARPEVALGPRRVLRVTGNDLFAGLLEDRAALREVQDFTMRGGEVQFFCMTKAAEEFSRRAMIDERRIDSAPLEIAAKMNDKAWLREAGAAIGLGHAFLPHRVSKDPDRVKSAIGELMEGARSGFVVIRPTNLAGGDGFRRIYRGDDLDAKLEGYFEEHAGRKILVEEGCRHDPYSTQHVVKRGRKPVCLGPTRQIISYEDGRHHGNTMAWLRGPANPHPHIDEEDRRTMLVWSEALAEHARTRIVSYNGTIGFDFLRRKRDGRLFISECNARQTASTYPLGVSAQLDGRGVDEWFLIMRNAVPTRARSYGELLDRLGDLAFAHVRGIVPFNPRLMTLDDPHCGLIAVGPDHVKAGAMLAEAKKRLVA